MADLAITNTAVALNTVVAIPATVAATEDGAGTAQNMVITPTKADAQLVIRAKVADTNGAVALTVTKGDHWAATADLALSCAQATDNVFILEGGKYTQSDGTIVITATPASGKKLKTDHAFVMSAFQLANK